MNKLWITFVCWFDGHNYTSKSMEGIKPSEAEIAGGVDGFFAYAIMYCKRCDHIYEPDQQNAKLLDKFNETRSP